MDRDGTSAAIERVSMSAGSRVHHPGFVRCAPGHAVPGAGARPVAGDERGSDYWFVWIGNGVAVTQSDQTAVPALARIRK